MDDRRTRSHPVRRVIATALTAVALASLVLTVPGAALASVRSVDLEITWTRDGSAETFASPDALRVGDDVTVHVATTGFEMMPGVSCWLTFSRGSTGAAPLLRAYIPDQAVPPPCHDWTFIVPPTTAGPYVLSAFVPISEDEQYVPEVELTVEDGGVARPVISNVPLLTWDLSTLFGDDRVRFGEPWSIPVPANGQHDCDFGLNGNYLTSVYVYGRADGCDPWTVTLPDIRPPAYRTDEVNGDPWMVTFHGRWARDDGSWHSSGETSSADLLVDDATDAVVFASDRPAAVFAADDNPYFTYVGTVQRAPRIAGIETGTCHYEIRNVGQSQSVAQPNVPLVDGACDPVSFEVTTTGIFQVYVDILDDDLRRVASASTGGEVVDPLPDPVIDAPVAADAGEAVDIEASTSGGSPLDYAIEPALEAAAATGPRSLAAAGPSCSGASGTFVLKDADRSATASCTFPAGGTYRITARFIDAVGTERSTSRLIEVVEDVAAPAVTAVRQRLVPGAQIGTSAIPVQMTWTATDVGSGVHHVRVDQQLDAGTWALVNDHLTAASMTRSLSRGHDYQFRVRAVDGASNTSPYAYSATFGPTAYTETNPIITYTGPWATTVSADAYGGTMRGTSAAGASATITFHGRSVAWVSPWSPVRGKAKVYLDGKLVSTVDLYRATLSQRRIAFAWNWTTAATHTLKIVNEATAGHRRIDVDTIVVLD